MKKGIFTIMAFLSLAGLSVCSVSCSDDDDDDNKKVNIVSDAQASAAGIANDVMDYVAAQQSGSTAASDALDNLVSDVKEYQTASDTAYKSKVVSYVADATGLSSETVTSLLTDGSTTSGAIEVLNSLSDAEKQSVLTNADAYVQGYHDALDLANAYATLANDSSDADAKNAALDQLETDIKDHYQTSSDTVYKKTYVKATALATGLSESVVKQILESDNPKATAVTLLGIDVAGGETAAQAAKDGAAAAEVLNSLKGKTVTELLNDQDLVSQVGTYKELYSKGSDEYKEAFKSALESNGVSSELTSLFDSDGDVDVQTIITLLGISA